MHDIAQHAGSIGATTQTLHREKIGPFNCTQALDKALNPETLNAFLQPVTSVIDQLEQWTPRAYKVDSKTLFTAYYSSYLIAVRNANSYKTVV